MESPRIALARSKPGFPRHHHIQDEQIEVQAFQLGASVSGGLGCGHAIALTGQKPREEIADAAIIIDHQQMRCVVGKRGG